LDYHETEYAGIVPPISAILNLNNDVYNFEGSKFLNPFKEGFIRSFSRMAVAFLKTLIYMEQQP